MERGVKDKWEACRWATSVLAGGKIVASAFARIFSRRHEKFRNRKKSEPTHWQLEAI
jgi:hypothetical protein